MKFSVAALMSLICTAALLCTAEGQPRISLRCECVKTYSGPPIPIEKILSLNVIPAGPKCKHEEIIARMNRGQMCLDSKQDWVISLKEKMNEKRKVKSQ